MTVVIRIPTALRKLAAGNETVSVEATHVGDAIHALREAHPDLAAQIVDENGRVRRFVNLFANDEDIRFLDDLQTPLKSGDELSIVPAIAGGAGAVRRDGSVPSAV